MAVIMKLNSYCIVSRYWIFIFEKFLNKHELLKRWSKTKLRSKKWARKKGGFGHPTLKPPPKIQII